MEFVDKYLPLDKSTSHYFRSPFQILLNQLSSASVLKTYKILPRLNLKDATKSQQGEFKMLIPRITKLTKIFITSLSRYRLIEARWMYEKFKKFRRSINKEMEESLNDLIDEWRKVVQYHYLFMSYSLLSEITLNVFHDVDTFNVQRHKKFNRWQRMVNFQKRIHFRINMAFIDAVADNHIEEVEYLLDKGGANINFIHKKYNFQTPLEMAIKFNYDEIIKNLQKKEEMPAKDKGSIPEKVILKMKKEFVDFEENSDVIECDSKDIKITNNVKHFARYEENYYVERKLWQENGYNKMEISDDDLFNLNDKTLLINGLLGMGKTTLLSRFITQKAQNSDLMIVKMDLTVYSSIFSELQDINSVCKELNFSPVNGDYGPVLLLWLLQLSIHFPRSQPIESEKEEKFFKYCYYYGKLWIVVDGFDQILPENQEIALIFMKKIHNETENRLWITTNPKFKPLLENLLEVKSYCLLPFDQKDINTFMENYGQEVMLKEMLTNNETIRKLLPCLEENSPLLLLLATEYLKNNQEKTSINVLDMFDFYINEKIKPFIDISNTFQNKRHFYQIAALRQLIKSDELMNKLSRYFNIHNKELYEQISNNEKNIKILEVLNNEIRFTNVIFSEYLAADFLVKKISSKYNEDILECINNMLGVCSEFFGHFLKALLVKEHLKLESPLIHIAAQKNLPNVVKFCIEKDYDCQKFDSHKNTPLHYVVENGFLDIASLLLLPYQLDDDEEDIARKNKFIFLDIDNYIHDTLKGQTKLNLFDKRWNIFKEIVFSNKSFTFPIRWLYNVLNHVFDFSFSIMLSYNSALLENFLNSDLKERILERKYYDYPSILDKLNVDVNIMEVENLIQMFPPPCLTPLDLVNRSDFYDDDDRLKITRTLINIQGTNATWLYGKENIDEQYSYITGILQAAATHGHLKTYKNYLSIIHEIKIEPNYSLHFKLACIFSQRVIIDYLLKNYEQSLIFKEDHVVSLIIKFIKKDLNLVDVAIIYFQRNVIINAKNCEGKTLFQFGLEKKCEFELIKRLVELGAYLEFRDNKNEIESILDINLDVKNYLEPYLRQSDEKPLTSLFEDEYPLHYAVKRDNLSLVKVLVIKGLSVYETDDIKCTPLHYVADNVEIARFLLENGAIFNATNKKRKAPCELVKPATDVYDFFKVIENAFSLNLKIFSDANIKAVFNTKNQLHQTLLHVVLEKGSEEDNKIIFETCFDKCKEYLPTIINLKDFKGNTPLHIAAKKGNFEVFKVLLKHGAFYDAVNSTEQIGLTQEEDRGKTPQQLTKCDKIRELFKLIEDTRELFKFDKEKAKNMDVMDYIDYQDKYGKTFLHYVVEKEEDDYDNVEYLLKNKANIDIADIDASTPINIAWTKGNLDIALLLLKYGAPLNLSKIGHFNSEQCIYISIRLVNLIKRIKENESQDSIQTTINEMYKKLKFEKLLMANIHDKNGNTYLHHAAQRNNIDIVKILLIEAVPFNVKNKYGNTAEDLTSNQEIKDLFCLIKDLFFASSCEKTNFLEAKADEVAIKLNALEIITKARQRDYENHRYNVVNLVHVAAKHGKLDMVEWLIKIGADVKATDFLENTAMVIAKENNQKDVAKYLENLEIKPTGV